MRIRRLLTAAAVSAAFFGLSAAVLDIGHAGAAPPPGVGHGAAADRGASSDHGANDTSTSNPYASTSDGSPSQNGNGVGGAVGKPCAGCVGQADNKNPPGQSPNGSDANNGYECDGNHGIGQTNPAHSGCAPSVTTTTAAPTTTTTTSTTVTTGGPGGTTTTTAAPGAGSTDSSQGGPTAVDTGSASSPAPSTATVTNELQQWVNGQPAWPVTRSASSSSPGALASTGVDIARYVLLGLLSILLGATLFVGDCLLRSLGRPRI